MNEWQKNAGSFSKLHKNKLFIHDYVYVYDYTMRNHVSHTQIHSSHSRVPSVRQRMQYFDRILRFVICT